MPWTVRPDDVLRYQGRGADFARQMNELLAATLRAGGVPDASLRTTDNSNAADGGVDAAVDRPLPAAADPGGWFDVPTCWQYKGCAAGQITTSEHTNQRDALRAEVRKPYVRELLAAGYGYRLCLADGRTPQQQAQWQEWLGEAVQEVAPAAPPPLVVTADRLADWITRHPGLVRRLRPELVRADTLDEWAGRETHLAGVYAPTASREAVRAAVRRHADLGTPAGGAVLALAGEAGVGKTRLVLEAVGDLPGVGAVLVHTDGHEYAVTLVEHFARHPDVRAVVVADECPATTRVRLGRLADPHADRLRVVAIDNDDGEPTPAAGVHRLDRLDRAGVEAVLEANFPEVHLFRRHAVAAATGGVVRLALDVCRNLHRLGPDGDTGLLAADFRDRYFRARLTDEQRRAVEVLGLVARVDRYAGPADPLPGLCEATAAGVTARQLRQVANRLRQAPGFVAVSGDHLFVAPRLIAQAAFRSGWDNLVRPDPAAFLNALPAALEDDFLRQVRDCGTPEARQAVVSRDAGLLRRLRPDDLPEAAPRLARLVEVAPELVGPRLVELVEACPLEQLAAVGWRQTLADLGRNLLSRRDLFPLGERLLYRLAVAEPDARHSGPAAYWATIFRPLLSGTPVPFADRLAVLERRFGAATTADEVRLCLAALEHPLNAQGQAIGHFVLPGLAFGRLRNPDWQWATRGERRDCWRLTGGLVRRLAASADSAVRDGVIDRVISRCFGLIQWGRLADVEAVVDAAPLTDRRLTRVVGEIDRVLHVWCRPDDRRLPESVEGELRAWRARLMPSTLHGRLAAAVGQDEWEYDYHHPADADAHFAALAAELVATPWGLEAELPWLSSADARGAARFGRHVGRVAPPAALAPVLAAAVRGPSARFAWGFLLALAERPDFGPAAANRLLDECCEAAPAVGLNLLTTGVAALRPLDRVLGLVDAGRLPLQELVVTRQLVGWRPLTADELMAVLDRLLPAVRAADPSAARTAVLVCGLHWQTAPASYDIPPPLRAALWELLTACVPLHFDDGWAWDDTLGRLAGAEPERAVALAVDAYLNAAGYDVAVGAGDFLAGRPPELAPAVMARLGQGLLADDRAAFRAARHDPHLIVRLPPEAVTGWVDGVGVAAARAVACHLPPPDFADGDARVPPLTQHLLDRYGDDPEFADRFTEWTAGFVYAGDEPPAVRAAALLADSPCLALRVWADRTRWLYDSASDRADARLADSDVP